MNNETIDKALILRLIESKLDKNGGAVGVVPEEAGGTKYLAVLQNQEFKFQIMTVQDEDSIQKNKEKVEEILEASGYILRSYN